MIYDEIRLPPPGGNLMYSAAEAVHVIDTLVAKNVAGQENLRHPKRLFVTLVKQKMIDEKRVPVKLSQLNCIYRAACDGASPLGPPRNYADGGAAWIVRSPYQTRRKFMDGGAHGECTDRKNEIEGRSRQN
mmetsp:Transcript_5918/g.14829  ORF Transcript_5918/g.14829 Transcript_5918/m.14829 type:complete len:131 (+) Transcript_5918:2389-2781(+)